MLVTFVVPRCVDRRMLALIRMGNINEEIRAYDSMRTDLETQHLGKWAIVHAGVLVGVFDSFEEAADHATQKFGRGPFLIREVGAAPTNLPISVMFAWNAQR